MKTIQTLISEDIVYALGWTVLHSLWQAMAIALVMVISFTLMPKQKANLRYAMANTALILVLLCSVVTFLLMYQSGGHSTSGDVIIFTHGSTLLEINTHHHNSHWSIYFIDYFNEHLPMVVSIWILGIAFFTLRLLGGLAYIQHLKHNHNTPLPSFWQRRLITLSGNIHLRKTIQLVESSIIKVPMVVGYFKPMILMPIGAVNALSTEEVEAILAHELAHISRNDYLLNIFQSIIEILFYFNPAVWWISANIRTERENCCDDIAIKMCGNPLTYAKALVNLQEMYHTAPRMAMSFSGRKNQLLNRVKRILNQPQNRSNIMEKCMATTFMLLVIIALSIRANTPENVSNTWIESIETAPEIAYQFLPHDTIPKLKNKR